MTKSMNHQYIDSLVELGKKNPKVVVLDADLGTSARTPQFMEKYPERAINCGIAEQNMVGVASGLAYEGNIPFVHSLAAFIMRRCYDQLYQSVAIPNLNIKVIGVYAGLNGQDGNSHQSINDIALAASLPNFSVVVPGNSYEVKELMNQLVDAGPLYLRLSREHVRLPLEMGYSVDFGKFSKIKCGGDVAILSTGLMVNHALVLSEHLEEDGVGTSVYSVHTIEPFDNDEIERIRRKFKKIVTIEEHLVDFGLGNKVMNSSEEPIKICRIGLTRALHGSAPLEDLLKHSGITIQDTLKKVRKYLC